MTRGRPTVTCADCGQTGPGRTRSLCQRCYAAPGTRLGPAPGAASTAGISRPCCARRVTDARGLASESVPHAARSARSTLLTDASGARSRPRRPPALAATAIVGSNDCGAVDPSTHLAALRSLFGTLKAERLLFSNPTARLREPRAAAAPILGLKPGSHAELLAWTSEPVQQLIVLLAAVHALHTAQLCRLRLDDADLGAGVLLVDGRPRRLDSLTRERLTGWLELRCRCCPASANPHLLVNQSTAGGVAPVARSLCRPLSAVSITRRTTCVPTASSTRSTPPTATPSRSCTCSGSATEPRCATAPPSARSTDRLG